MRARRTPAPAARPWLRTVALLAGLALLVTACGGDDHGEPRHPVDQAAIADSIFSPAAFDTITWASDSVRLLRGNEIYAAECRRCHGYLGRGDTEYAAERDIAVPSLVVPEWEYERDLRGALRQIFVGHEDMPAWGLGRLMPREIQAATYYVLYQLRPDVLGDTARSDAGS